MCHFSFALIQLARLLLWQPHGTQHHPSTGEFVRLKKVHGNAQYLEIKELVIHLTRGSTTPSPDDTYKDSFDDDDDCVGATPFTSWTFMHLFVHLNIF